MTNTSTKRARDLRQHMPDSEQRLWYHLRNKRLAGYKFRRQHPIGHYYADFACLDPKLIIEADGSQHLQQEHHDTERTQYLKTQGFQVLRFWNNEVLAQTDAVLETIYQALITHSNSPSPSKKSNNKSPSPSGRGVGVRDKTATVKTRDYP